MKCHSNKNNWQQALMSVITDPQELFSLLELDAQFLPAAKKAAQLFPLKVPISFINRIEKGNPNDPLLRQILPMHLELNTVPGYSKDPLQEAEANPLPGLLHKYQGRVLLTLTGSCGVNCRFCFRRHFPYQENNPGTLGWAKTLNYIENDPSIAEIILSGGDPLTVPDLTLKELVEKISTIPHIKRLRIHSRMPIVIPERITPQLIEAITSPSLKTILVVHCNHPNEINEEVRAAARSLLDANICLLNQSVLLKDVNTDVDILVELSDTLFSAGILPYYLHKLDKVQGAAHFDIDDELVHQLHWQVTKRLSGYLVPKLVVEEAGAPAKIGLSLREFCTG